MPVAETADTRCCSFRKENYCLNHAVRRKVSFLEVIVLKSVSSFLSVDVSDARPLISLSHEIEYINRAVIDD